MEHGVPSSDDGVPEGQVGSSTEVTGTLGPAAGGPQDDLPGAGGPDDGGPDDGGPVTPGPRWRHRIERTTEFAVGLAALARTAAKGAPPADAPAASTPWRDAVLGLALEGQRLALDAAERTVDAGGRLARVTLRVPGVRESAVVVGRAASPTRLRGADFRAAAADDMRRHLPGYIASVTGAALDLVNLDDVLARVDIDGLIRQVDIDGLIRRVDIDALIQRVDIDALISGVDIDGLVGRVDIESLIGRVDLDSLVGQTDLGAIIAQSTGGIASQGLDVVRRQGIGLDTFIERWAARVLPRRLGDAPVGPPLLVQGDNGSAEGGAAAPPADNGTLPQENGSAPNPEATSPNPEAPNPEAPNPEAPSPEATSPEATAPNPERTAQVAAAASPEENGRATS